MSTAEKTRPITASLRWERWQSTPVAQKYLTDEVRAQGYTVVRVPPPTREVFLEVVWLLIAYARLVRRRRACPEALAAWEEWTTWTRRLRAYLERVSTDGPGTVPAVPPALPGLLTAEDRPGVR